MPLNLPKPLNELVQSKFQTAKEAQDLTFSTSEVAVIHTKAGLPFQLRYCPSLAKKPTNGGEKTPHHSKDESKPKEKKEKFDPFAEPSQELLVTSIPHSGVGEPTHNLVLNKFPIIPYHFIVATAKEKAQTAVLEEDDLAVSYACLKEWGKDGDGERRLFGFFNSGDSSGASQAHRHLQFLPVESIQEAMAEGMEWELLIDVVERTSRTGFADSPSPNFPITLFSAKIPQDSSPSQLHSIYRNLYSKAITAVRNHVESNVDNLQLYDISDGSLSFSYNLGMTTTAMAICPRRKEGKRLWRKDGSEIGFVALNGTALAGTLMVKGEDEWECMKSQDGALDDVLEAIGIPLPKNGEKSQI